MNIKIPPLCLESESLQLGYSYHWHTGYGRDPGKQDILRLVKGTSSLCCTLVKLPIFIETCNSLVNHAVINRGKMWLARVLIVSCVWLRVNESSVLLVGVLSLIPAIDKIDSTSI